MSDELDVRVADEGDEGYAEAAAALIAAAAADNDVARRPVEWLRDKLLRGRAAVAVADGELVGFGYWSDWEGEFVSHSGLVVRTDKQGSGLGRRLKDLLFESSRRHFPRATLMSLTNSPAVKAMNLSLGFKVVPIERLTKDPSFWEGCKACRNYETVRARGEKCCCEAMILEPDQRT